MNVFVDGHGTAVHGKCSVLSVQQNVIPHTIEIPVNYPPLLIVDLIVECVYDCFLVIFRKIVECRSVETKIRRQVSTIS